ncbi:methyltransferase [Hoyosella sp. YIM 151337]|uniref:methyltransferase n=1 Tax=Hoyosella sp. YIM 151337 TaxID=2992742 RepID=UPI0022357DEC|nr:methyltransferase [Hoyosella sp. YIM 151337]MCW4355498.1 methyltransferase [Hoyosella sp. YIM 151337]
MTLDIARENAAAVPEPPGLPVRPRVFRLPGVYRPQEDSVMLAREYLRSGLAGRGSVLELCCGTGYLSLIAARSGVHAVTAVDLSWRAVVSARVNAGMLRAPVRVRRGDFARMDGISPASVVLANPPYVPWFGSDGSRPCAKWDAGADGRAVIDELCAAAPRLVASGGSLLMVHSAISDTAQSLLALSGSGFAPRVVAREHIPFGPVMRSRAQQLAAAGYIEPGQDLEELVVIRADKL